MGSKYRGMSPYIGCLDRSVKCTDSSTGVSFVPWASATVDPKGFFGYL
jgi:hypothetical protein